MREDIGSPFGKVLVQRFVGERLALGVQRFLHAGERVQSLDSGSKCP